jgi:hypothetical protein
MSGVRRNASAAVLVPILGLIGGLIAGGIRVGGRLDIREIELVLKWGVTGFFAGLGLILLLALQFRGRDVISIRRLLALVAVAALVTWFFARIFLGVIGDAGF